MSVEESVGRLSQRLDDAQMALRTHGLYYSGGQPLSFLSVGDREALKGRIPRLPINYARHAIDTLADRLLVEGFTSGADSTAKDLERWQLWRRAGLVEVADEVHRTALVFGRAPVSVWSAPGGGVRVRPEDPRQCVVTYDPATGAPTMALKRWQADGFGWAVLFGPDVIRRLCTASSVPLGGVLPVEGWTVVETIPNALGVVPIVELRNRRQVDGTGVSELADIEPLVDALTKIMSDAMVSAEFGARPRRYAIGVEIQEDAEGNPVNPFIEGPGRIWQLEGDKSTAAIGQLDPMSLEPYASLAALLTHQIAALAALPPHLAGIRQDQPASAEALRASESALAARARARQRAFSAPWAQVMALVAMVDTGRPGPECETVWADPETTSTAASADAALKLVQGGILSVDGALDRLGYSPEEIEVERIRRRQQSLDNAGVDVVRLLGGAA